MDINSEMNEVERDPAIQRLALLVEAALTFPESSYLQHGGPSLKVVWTNLRLEVHELLCTKSSKYKTEREIFNKTAKPAIAALAAHLTQNYGLAAETAAGLSSLSLLLPFKMAVDVWCVSSKNEELIKDDEVISLKAVTKKSATTTKSKK